MALGGLRGGSACERPAGSSRAVLGWGGGGLIRGPQGSCCLSAWKAKDCVSLPVPLHVRSQPCQHPSSPSLWLYAAMEKVLPCCITHCGEKQPWAGMSEHPKTGRCGRNKEMPGHTRAAPVLVEGSLAGVCWTPDLLPHQDGPRNAVFRSSKGLYILHEWFFGISNNSIPSGVPTPPCPHMPLRSREWTNG